jgi:hypothetical protein
MPSYPSWGYTRKQKNQLFQGLQLAILPILGLNIIMKNSGIPRGSHIIRKAGLPHNQEGWAPTKQVGIRVASESQDSLEAGLVNNHHDMDQPDGSRQSSMKKEGLEDLEEA